MLIDKHKIQMPSWDDKNPVVVKEWAKCLVLMRKARVESYEALLERTYDRTISGKDEKGALMKNPI